MPECTPYDLVDGTMVLLCEPCVARFDRTGWPCDARDDKLVEGRSGPPREGRCTFDAEMGPLHEWRWSGRRCVAGGVYGVALGAVFLGKANGERQTVTWVIFDHAVEPEMVAVADLRAGRLDRGHS